MLLRPPAGHSYTMLNAAKQRRMGNTPSHAIALAAIFAVGVKSQEFCSCSPTQFEFQLTLNQNCDVNGMYLELSLF